MSDHALPPPVPPEPSWSRVAAGAEDRTLEENWLFRLRRERFRSRATGREHDYYVMHLADAVLAIALTDDDRLVMVRQFRAGSRHDSLEPPGGLLDPGEDPCVAGARELLEETGYAGDPPVLLGTLWSNPSILTSRVATIVVANARRVAEPRLDQAEEVDVELVPVRAIPELIRDGRIDHALCVAGLLWWIRSRPEESAI
jgi:ADP-ribose pyrophosphatase